MIKRLLFILLLAQPSVSLAAEEQENADLLLERIKLALLDATLEKEVRVVTAGYLDESGRLVESTYFGSDLNVAGVRVLSYLDEPAEVPAIDPASLPAGLSPLFAEACSLSELAMITRNAEVFLRLNTPSLPLSLQPPLDKTLPELATQALQRAGWQALIAEEEVLGSGYQALLLRRSGRVATDYRLEINIEQIADSAIPGWSDELVSVQRRSAAALHDLISRNPVIAVPPVASAEPLAVRISYHLTGPDAENLAQHQEYYRFRAAAASLVQRLSVQGFHESFREGLEATLSSLAMRDDTCKQLLHVLHSGVSGQEFTVRVGSRNGVRPGMRFLLLGDELIRNGLVGAASAALSIGEVTVVDEASSTIRELTERSDDAQPLNWALPF
jgi:hypothetical protein